MKIARLSVTAKVADALLMMYEKYGGNGNNNTLNLVLSRQEIADLSSTTQEQVSKVLSVLKRKGLIETQVKKISILKPDELKQIAMV